MHDQSQSCVLCGRPLAAGDLYCAACGAESGAVSSGTRDVRTRRRLRRPAGRLHRWVLFIVGLIVVWVAYRVLALNWRWLSAPIVLIFAVPGSIAAARWIIWRVTGEEVGPVWDEMGPPPSPEERRHIREFDARLKKALERRRKEDGPTG